MTQFTDTFDIAHLWLGQSTKTASQIGLHRCLLSFRGRLQLDCRACAGREALLGRIRHCARRGEPQQCTVDALVGA